MLSRSWALIGTLFSLTGSVAPAVAQNQLNIPFRSTQIKRVLTTDGVKDSDEFKGAVEKLASAAIKKPNPFVYIERGGSAWRSEQRAVNDEFSTTAIIPEDMPNGLSKYNYIGLNQDIYENGRVIRVNSDIGLVVCYKSKRGVPFITTEDPTLKVSKSTIQVWKNGDNLSTRIPHDLKLHGDKYYSITSRSKYYQDATFKAGDKVTISLSLLPVDAIQSLVVLTLRSDDKTVIIRIPRDDRALVSKRKMIVHRVAAATISKKESKNYSPGKLLIASSNTIPFHEYPKYPSLHEAFVRTQIGVNKDVSMAMR